MIIGLTGLYCAGKNYTALLLEKRGLPVLDLDKLGHEVIRAETEAIVRRFGNGVLGPDGTTDRRLLGKQVFARPEELAALEGIIHPAVNRMTDEWIESRQTELCVINAALLHRSSAFGKLGAVIVVTAPFPVRLFRARLRDKIPLGELLKRVHSQGDFPRYKTRQTAKTGNDGSQLFGFFADMYIIRNSGFPGSRRALERRIDAILEGLRHGKEKITVGSGFGGSIPGDRGKRRDLGF